MTTSATTPLYPLPGKSLEVTFTLTEATANFVRVWCTAAPEGSDLDGKLRKNAAARVEVYTDQGGAKHPWRTSFDVGGRYTFVAQEYRRGNGFTGGYEDDPRAAPLETKLGTEATLHAFAGQRFESPIGFGEHRATLVYWAWDDRIRQTTEQVHGEATPTIAKPTTPAARNAARSTATTAALDALRDQSSLTAAGSPETIVANMIAKLNAHFANAAKHNAADAINPIRETWSSAPSPQDLAATVSEILTKLRRHMTNDDGFGAGSADGSTDPITSYVHATPFHKVGGVRVSDFLNSTVHRTAGSVGDAYGALADIWRAYEAHRVSTAVHGSADSTNTLTALPLLLVVHQRFLEGIASTSPSASPGEQAAAVYLATWTGARVT